LSFRLAPSYAGISARHATRVTEGMSRQMHENAGTGKPGLLVTDSGTPLDEALRLRRIGEICPGIEIIRRGPWQAVIPEPDGERTVVRWELAEFLERLDALLMARLPQASR
jgi:hypothetical protein